MSHPRIAIFGTCVSRDLFEDPALRPSLAQYTARSSVISVVAPPVAIDPDSVVLESPWQRRCVLEDFAKTFFADLERNRADWLLIDLLDERFEVLWTAGSCVTRSSAFTGARLDDAISGEGDPLRRLTPEADAHLAAAIAAFAERVAPIVPNDRVVVHRAGWLPRYRDGATVLSFPDERVAYAERHNAVLDRAYDLLQTRFDGAHTIDLDRDSYLADANHRWTLEPFHYEPAYNAAAGTRLKQLLAS